jgi:dipeptidyl aminopeptidase/acylaminoacyl peptidase
MRHARRPSAARPSRSVASTRPTPRAIVRGALPGLAVALTLAATPMAPAAPASGGAAPAPAWTGMAPAIAPPAAGEASAGALAPGLVAASAAAIIRTSAALPAAATADTAAATARPAAPPPSAGARVPAAGRRRITETDLFRFVWVADPRISPDGRWIAFVRETVDARREGYETAIWIAATEPAAGAAAAPRPLTAGPHDSSPRWSPDGRRLAFLRQPTRAAAEAEAPSAPGGPVRRPGPADAAGRSEQLFVLPLDGGEARQLTSLPGGVDAPAWSPDGKTLAFLSRTSPADLARKGRDGTAAKAPGAAAAAAGGGDIDPPAEHESDVRVITRAVYRANGAGYLDPSHPRHVWTVAAPAGGGEAPPLPRQLTLGDIEEQEPAWAPDGSRVYFASTRTKEPYYEPPFEGIYAVPAAGGEPAPVASFRGGIGELAVSPDGREIAFIGAAVGNPVRSYDQPDLWVVATAGRGEPRNLTADFDFDVGGHLAADQHPPRAAGHDTPAWSADGRSLLVNAEERGRVELRRFAVAGGPSRQVTAGDHEVEAYSATPDGARLAMVIASSTVLGDLFVMTGEGPPRQLTDFNAPLFGELTLTPAELVTYRSFDGREIQAWVQKPPDFRAGKPYPLILDIHGGPHTAYGYTFLHEAQWMAAKGYVVLYPNPRGSTAYGQEFGNVIQYHYPGDDFKDLMAGVDELVRRGWADPRRLGVTGGSGGGLLTDWTITQTDRFAAAVSQRSIADWAGWWYTADFTLFTPRWFRGAPFEDPQDFTARSPITYIKNVRTPLMLIEGEADYRTPPSSGGEVMFRALKYLRRPVVMVRFPGESHELSRSGRPWHRVERLQHIVRWFDKYLQGVKTDLYDVP